VWRTTAVQPRGSWPTRTGATCCRRSAAAGRCVATAIGGFNPGDCLAAALIAAEAGAVLPWGVPEDGAPFIAAAPGVADELLSIWPAA
jgi:fructose-1,6-bisphosphatase/inositol monophosphatase family enzyme